MNSTVSEVVQKRHFDLEAAEGLLINRQLLDYSELLKEKEVLYLGESHNDYSVAEHILGQVETFKESGVKTFAVELNPEDQPILDEINQGNFSNADKLEFSLGFGSVAVEANKKKLVRELVKNRIEIVGVANWHKSTDGFTLESERAAADIIEERVKLGKVVVLIGAQHAIYAEGDLRYPFVRSPDLLREKGVRVKTTRFIGGMRQAGEYDRSVEGYLRRAAVKSGIKDSLFYIDKSDPSFPLTKYNNDGLIHLPHKPFRSAQDRKKG